MIDSVSDLRNELEKSGFTCKASGPGSELYTLDAQTGSGTCCFYTFRNLFSLIQLDCVYRRNMAVSLHVPNRLFFWLDPDGAARCYVSIGEEHLVRVASGTPLRMTAFALSPAFYAECLRLLPVGAQSKLDRALQLLDGTVSIPEAAGVLRRMEATSPVRSGSGLYYEGKLKELLSYILRWYEDTDRGTAISVGDRQAVFRVMGFLRENLSVPLSIEACTRIACMGKSKLSDLFRRINGRSISGFFLSLRMERAKEVLSGTNRTISNVARAVGYKKQTSFSTAFKEYAGLSPHDYRKRLAYDYHGGSLSTQSIKAV